MKKKVALHNLGCKVNAYELEAMSQMLKNGGYEIVPFDMNADIYIINTCTVTNIADRKSRQMIRKAKKINPQAIVVAAGCYVQASADKLIEDDTVDIIIGNNKKQELLAILDAFFVSNVKQQAMTDINATKDYENLSIEDNGEHTRAYVKVQDGCNQFCTYCIIPYMRGRVRSRQLDDVILEITRLANEGYQEVVLTGIHLSSYGVERGEEQGLLELIRAVHQISKIRRIRLGSLEPGIITEAFVRGIAKLEKLCPHFHLSMQSGCDETLKRMNRRYTTREFAQKCTLLRQHHDNLAITTDIIVGFPGESEEEFVKTKEFVSKINFYETHIFKYSPRKGTKAADMVEQVPETVKNKRSKEMIAMGAKNKRHFMERFIGCECEVLVEEKAKIKDEMYCVGHTREYLKIAFKMKGNQVGKMITVMACDIIDTEYVLGERPCVL